MTNTSPVAPKWGSQFWKATAERVVSTFLQAGIAAIPTSVILFSQVNFVLVADTAALAALLSLAKGIIANAQSGDGPGFGAAEAVQGRHQA